jgi:hypothetical protein
VGSTVFYDSANELATLSNTFRVAGAATDPTTVTLTVVDPLGDDTVYTQAGGDFTHTPASGAYSIDIPCTTVGLWTYRWEGTGAASDSEPGSWNVASGNFSDLCITPEQLKSRTGISDSLDDREILGVCRAITEWIEDTHCETVFARRMATVLLEPCGYYSVQTPDLVSVTTLKTDDDADGVFETTWATSDYELQPVNAAAHIRPKPYTAIAAVGSRLFPVTTARYGRKARAQLVGVLGWPSMPAPVTEAAGLLGADYLAACGMKFGVMSFGDYAVRAKLNGPALEMLRGYRKHPVLIA